MDNFMMMNSIDNKENKQTKERLDEIVKLKLQHPLSEEGKLLIQKLQQKLNKSRQRKR